MYYSLELLPHQNLFELNTLCKMAKQELINPQAQMTPDKLHVTLDVMSEPDMKYHERFLSQGKQKIEITQFYTDRESFAAVKVALRIPAKNMYMLLAVPHISLCRSYDSRWRDVGFRIKQATYAAGYGVSDVRGWRFSSTLICTE